VKNQANSSPNVVQPIEPVDLSQDMQTEYEPKIDPKIQQEIQYFIGSAWNVNAKQVTVQIQSK
jgi:hypothetical protein